MAAATDFFIRRRHQRVGLGRHHNDRDPGSLRRDAVASSTGNSPGNSPGNSAGNSPGNSRIRGFEVSYLAVCGVALTAVTAAALVPDFGPPGRYHADKAVHALAYAVLTFLSMRLARTPVQAGLMVLALALLSGATEFAQLIVPGRYFSYGDLAANAAGLAIGAAAFIRLRDRLNPRFGIR